MEHDGGRRCHVPRLEPDQDDLEESTRAAVLLSDQGMVYFDPDRTSEDLILARVAVAAGSSGHRYRASAVALRFH